MNRVTKLIISSLLSTFLIADPAGAVNSDGLATRVNLSTTLGSWQIVSPTVNSSVPPIPIDLPVNKGNITFSNILERVDTVAQEAFANVQRSYLANSAPRGIKTTLWVGPSTEIIGPISVQERVARTQRLWSGFRQPKSVNMFFFNTTDQPLAEKAFDKWTKSVRNYSGAPATFLRNTCLSNNGPSAPLASKEPLGDCGGANAGVADSSGSGMGIFGVPTAPDGRTDPYRMGALEAHEYTHIVQAAQFVGTDSNPGGKMQSVAPCWIGEGQAHFAGKALFSSDANDYLKQRNGEALDRTNESGNKPPRTAAGISSYLSLATLATCQKTYSWGYATGMLAVEALTAIGGVESTMALYTQQARGKKFRKAFKLVYGISWKKARPILVQAIAKAYLVPNMSQ